MKKISLFLAFTATILAQSTSVDWRQIKNKPANLPNGYVATDANSNASIPDVILGPKTIGPGASQLPAASSCSRCVTVVTDASTNADCTSGGGTAKAICFSDGSAWTNVIGSGGGGSGANANGYYLVNRSANAPVNAVNLGVLGNGLLKLSVSAGVATPSTAVAGTDYQSAITTGTTAQYLRGDLSLGTFPTNLSSFTNGPGYITGNQTITFTGGCTGSGTTAVSLTCSGGGGGGAVASGTVALATTAIAAGACATTQTVAASGVLTTSVVMYSPNTDPTSITGFVPSTTGSLHVWAFPTANNVNFRVCNDTSNPITPSALTLNWKVF